MSFGINGPDNIPAIQKAQNAMNNGGGGGNLGYFQQKKKKKDEKNEQDVLELSSLTKGDDELEEEDIDLSLKAIGSHIKNFFTKKPADKEEEKIEINDETIEKENPEE